MKIGVPKGLLYYRYHPFIENFFAELGCEIVLSSDTNKSILDIGSKYCVDEACLPIKIYHGHVCDVKDKCDYIFVPRIMSLYQREYICPKFCGLPEMILNSVPNLPKIITTSVYDEKKKGLQNWAIKTGRMLSMGTHKIQAAYEIAIDKQKNYKDGYDDREYKMKVALVGHPYTISDVFLNMDLVRKLHNMGIGVITEEYVDENNINNQMKYLFKRPFWTFARKSYGFSTYLVKEGIVDGIVYISSFGCGIDSVVIELIKERIGDFPMLILKIDEHTGEAGFNTRIEAFADMLEGRAVV